MEEQTTLPMRADTPEPSWETILKQVRKYAWGICRSGYHGFDADDVAQQVMFKIHDKGLQLENLSNGSYLYRITANTFYDLYRPNKKFNGVDDPMLDELTKYTQSNRFDAERMWQQICALLTQQERLLLEQRVLGEKSYETLAALHGSTPAKIKYALEKIIRKVVRFSTRRKLRNLDL